MGTIHSGMLITFREPMLVEPPVKKHYEYSHSHYSNFSKAKRLVHEDTEEYMLCVTASNNILENANCEEDKLCATASLIAKKICCVLLPAS